jgi:hypothetical protein
MHNANKPDPADLPSTAQLLKSTAIAAVTALVILVTIVLPAEYGVDPTRLGSVLGLTEMGRIKMQLAEEAAADASPPPESPASVAEPVPAVIETPAGPPVADAASPWRDEVVFSLAPDAGTEYKLVMKEAETAEFEWFTDGAKVNFDTHADRPGVDYHGYEKGSLARHEGTLIAAFDGSHGWFWRNRSGAPMTITLRTRGDYAEMKRVL